MPPGFRKLGRVYYSGAGRERALKTSPHFFFPRFPLDVLGIFPRRGARVSLCPRLSRGPPIRCGIDNEHGNIRIPAWQVHRAPWLHRGFQSIVPPNFAVSSNLTVLTVTHLYRSELAFPVPQTRTRLLQSLLKIFDVSRPISKISDQYQRSFPQESVSQF